MVKIQSVDFSQDVYHPGETLMGTIKVKASREEIHGRQIMVHVLGKAQCAWAESKRETYADKETFFDHKILLPSDMQFNESPQGVADYSFECLLPFNLPSTFYAEYGNIYYQVKVSILSKSLFQFSVDFKAPFKVISTYCLPRATLEPFELTQREMAENPLCCIGAFPVEWTIRVPRRGFLLGEVIDFEIDVDNSGGKSLHDLYVKLKKVVTYTAQGVTKCATEFVSMSPSLLTSDTKSEEFLRVQGHVPMPLPLPLSSVVGSACRIIHVGYILKFILVIRMVTLSKEVTVDIGNRKEVEVTSNEQDLK